MSVASMLQQHQRYEPRQYDLSPCAGLAAGDVCPALLWPCAIEHGRLTPGAPWPAGAGECTIRRLDGLGFNPTIVPVGPPDRPGGGSSGTAAAGRGGAVREQAGQDAATGQDAAPWLAPLGEELRRGTRYVAVDRYEANNPKVRCRNPRVHPPKPSSRRGANTGARLYLLDGSLRVLGSAVVEGGRCVQGIWRVLDARLHAVGGALWISYKNAWSSRCVAPPPAAGGMAALRRTGARRAARNGSAASSSLAPPAGPTLLGRAPASPEPPSMWLACARCATRRGSMPPGDPTQTGARSARVLRLALGPRRCCRPLRTFPRPASLLGSPGWCCRPRRRRSVSAPGSRRRTRRRGLASLTSERTGPSPTAPIAAAVGSPGRATPACCWGGRVASLPS